MNIEEVKMKVHDELRLDQQALHACILIIDFLEKSDNDSLKFITFNTLKQKVPTENEGVIFRAATYLTGENSHLLNVNFLYSEGDFSEELTRAEVAEANETGILYISGNPIRDFQAKIHIYFSLNTGRDE
ncbi:hypothetical protein [Rahnella variigena]|mgnify:CR=1 FL=1|jgi:hypothetical protein|uniref:Uncharacterized protein n=1 Tax=Rahnella variigena TaxID=574964 RepID=A0ABX9PN46_9GAMM|nr:hypothetical protein [Rahnella variigena]RJT53614.1 hypothetical protein D6D38_11355 [Rahnella variigena]RKF66308.1 hypothetical protein CKQ54_23210 [Rahnella variigena]